MVIAFGVLIGLALGLTGSGGSIFAVPLLIYGLDVAPKNAIVISLTAVALTAAAGAIEGWYTRLVELRAALIFAAAGVMGAPIGVRLGGRSNDSVILVSFALLMLAVAAYMWLKATHMPLLTNVVRARYSGVGAHDAAAICRYMRDGKIRLNAPCGAALLGVGLLVGMMSGFFGVGGGFLIVPALMLITEMGIHRAVATSLVIIALIGLAGVASAAISGREIGWGLAGLFLIGGVFGMGLGRALASHLAGPTLQKLLAIAMVLLATFILIHSLDLLPQGVIL